MRLLVALSSEEMYCFQILECYEIIFLGGKTIIVRVFYILYYFSVKPVLDIDLEIIAIC